MLIELQQMSIGKDSGTLSFPMEILTHLWYIRTLADRYVFQWGRLFYEGLAFIKRDFSRVLVMA